MRFTVPSKKYKKQAYKLYCMFSLQIFVKKKATAPIKQKIKLFTREKSIVSKTLRNTQKSSFIFEWYALENVQFFNVSRSVHFTCPVYYHFFPTTVVRRIDCSLLAVRTEIKNFCIFTLKTNEKINRVYIRRIRKAVFRK